MIPNQKPYKLVCPKCSFSKFYPQGSIGDAQPYNLLVHCPKCKALLERTQEVGVLDEFLGNISSLFESFKK